MFYAAGDAVEIKETALPACFIQLFKQNCYMLKPFVIKRISFESLRVKFTLTSIVFVFPGFVYLNLKLVQGLLKLTKIRFVSSKILTNLYTNS